MAVANHIAVFRFSSMGDVAMTVPVLRELLQQNPTTKITLVSREKFKSMFRGIPRLEFFAADLDGKHKGVDGLFALSKELKKEGINQVADLHNVLRSKILCALLASNKVQTAKIDKGRAQRKALLKQTGNDRLPIRSMAERYADVFRSLGYSLKLSHQLTIGSTLKERAVGLAPFAMYEGKMYPQEESQKLALLIAEMGVRVYLFGSKQEAHVLDTWEELHPNITSVAGDLGFDQELDLIKTLRLMISMDSANMHLASLVGTRVLSVWGNTHPYMGFLGYGQSMDDVVQDETFTQRPTSVFGKEASSSKKLNFFVNITPEMIAEKVVNALEE